jgi:hypothetical protein
MRFYKAKIILISSFLVVGFLGTPAQADSLQLVVAADHTTGYSRALFKHWIDADKDGCDTRAEVLIEEAVTKPQVGAKCTLTGGKWLSAYDGVEVTSASKLDVDHMVPLAEAWRSGAWKWSAAQRQAYANDLDDSRALIAVTLSTNRSKGDKDPALWMPSFDQCTYTQNWISIKFKYSLTVDANEATKLNSLINSCGLDISSKSTPLPTSTSQPPLPIVTVKERLSAMLNRVEVFVDNFNAGANLKNSYLVIRSVGNPAFGTLSSCSLQGVSTRGNTVPIANTDIFLNKPEANRSGVIIKLSVIPNTYICNLVFNAEYDVYIFVGDSKGKKIAVSEGVSVVVGEIITPTPTPIPTITPSEIIVTPGAFCAPAGATGKSETGVSYTCKTSPTDTRNRWRQ